MARLNEMAAHLVDRDALNFFVNNAEIHVRVGDAVRGGHFIPFFRYGQIPGNAQALGI